jgi:hypothetical protein
MTLLILSDDDSHGDDCPDATVHSVGAMMFMLTLEWEGKIWSFCYL